MNSSNPTIHSWYCARGAKRGLVLALFTAAIWFGWAIGYIQGRQYLFSYSTQMVLEAAPVSIEKNTAPISQSI